LILPKNDGLDQQEWLMIGNYGNDVGGGSTMKAAAFLLYPTRWYGTVEMQRQEEKRDQRNEGGHALELGSVSRRTEYPHDASLTQSSSCCQLRSLRSRSKRSKRSSRSSRSVLLFYAARNQTVASPSAAGFMLSASEASRLGSFEKARSPGCASK
jgi:hypothetical protein